MVALTEATASNERIASTFPNGLVAVFVGGTSGVGEYTLKKFAKYTPKSRVYIVGRSQEAADRIINECRQLSPGSKFEFIKSDVSLLKNVDQVCRQIKSKETAINLLFQSQGSMAFDAVTAEGLPWAVGLPTHGRMRFVVNLLPLIQNARSLRRVVSISAATYEGAIDLDNIYAKGFGLFKWRNQLAAVQSLLLTKVAREAPDVSFVHTVPGIVKGGIMREADFSKSLGLSVIVAISRLIEPLVRTPPDESGERNLFLATSAKYPPSSGDVPALGVPLAGGLTVTNGINKQTMYSVDNKGESASPKVAQLLAQYKENGTEAKVWDYIEGDFKRITGTEVAS